MADQDPPSGPPQGGPPRVHLQLDEEMSQGVYTNFVVVNHSESEFVLDFAFVPPGQHGHTRARVRSRVVSSPQHTKRLLRALTKNVERYEERFGKIPMGDDDEPSVH